MYYHCRELKYVEYGKVYPPPESILDEDFKKVYKWLGYYCKFYPQVWLSRSHSSITGFKRTNIIKKRSWVIRKRQITKENINSVLFGFDILPGAFPVSYTYWDLIIFALLNCSNNIEEQNKQIIEYLNIMEKDCREHNEVDPEMQNWANSNRNLDVFLNQYLFKDIYL